MVTIYHLNPVLCVLDNCRPCLRPFRALLHRTPHHFTTKDALDVPFTLHNCSLQQFVWEKIRFFSLWNMFKLVRHSTAMQLSAMSVDIALQTLPMGDCLWPCFVWEWLVFW